MRRLLTLLVLAAAAPGAGAQDPPRATTAEQERIRADVARLAAAEWQGRRAGSDGGEQAAEWLAGEFRRLGLAPAGEAGGYFQPFGFIDGVKSGPGNALVIADGARFTPGQDFQPLAFSAAGTASGEVVFAGYGLVAPDLGRDDYAGLDVKDRIVLVLRFGPDGDDPQSKWGAFTPLRLKASLARERGARALLAVTGPRTQDVADDLVPLRSDASFADAGLPAFSLRRAVADALLAPAGKTLDAAQRALDESGQPNSFVVPGTRVTATADVTPVRATTRNVLGLLRGSGSEVVVLGAHYDHLGLGMRGSLEAGREAKIHHGADDNASGVAGLLALARRLSARGAPPTRSLLFVAFGAEEQGALGSSHFVKQPPLPLERVVAMLNLDMIGRLREDTLDVHGVGTSPVWKPLVEQAGREAGLKLRTHEGGYGPSDHNAFYVAGKPVLFAFTGSHADYHRASDTADKVDAAGIARVVSFVEPVTLALLGSAEPVAFTRVAAEKEAPTTPARGLRVWVGGIPDYSEERVGVTFSGVTPGSPAEKAGIQAGDVLVRFGDKEIRNIYDYTYALQGRKPGERLTLVVKRGAAEVSIELTLGARPSETR